MIDTQIIRSDQPEALDDARSTLSAGGLVAIPTDTVYGLACDAWNGRAVSKLYDVKGRSDQKSIPVLLSGVRAIDEVALASNSRVLALAERFWPGPLTLVVERKPELPSEISSTPTIGIRSPNQLFALRLLEEYGPLAVTSANLSDHANSITADQVLDALGGKIEMVIDAGQVGGGTPSTVIDTTQDPPMELRAGPIPLASVLEIWNQF